MGRYRERESFPSMEHISMRDERNGTFMAEIYVRFTGRRGVFEVPDVTRCAPGIVEAYKDGIHPILCTSDI